MRNSYLLILPDTIFAASPLILYYSFSSLIVSSVVMITFYILLKMLCLKRKGLSDGNVVSFTKKEHGFAVYFFVQIHSL